MPVLHIHTNISVDHPNDFLVRASNTVAQALAKPESYVMVLLSDNKPVSFAGKTEPAAFLELKSLGLSHTQTRNLSDTLCTFLEAELGVNASRIYIEFSGPERAMFGWNKATF